MIKRRRSRFICERIDNKLQIIEPKTRNNKSIWDLVKEFINNIPLDNTFSRKDLIFYCYTTSGEYMIKYQTAIDIYRNLLTHIEILQKTDIEGIYMKRRHIPDKLTTTKLKRIFLDKSWRRWFIPIEDRLES